MLIFFLSRTELLSLLRNSASETVMSTCTSESRYSWLWMVSRMDFSASDFQSSYCPGNHDFEYCYTNKSTGWTATRKADHVHGCVNAVEGNVIRKIEYYKEPFGPWTTLSSRTINEGHVDCVIAEEDNDRHQYRITISDVESNNLYHVSYYGNL